MNRSVLLAEIPEFISWEQTSPGTIRFADIRGPQYSDKKAIITRALREKRTCLMEHECKTILESMGIETSGGLIATSEDDAVEKGRMLGYPLVLKIVSPDLTHKTDCGGVKLNLRNEREVRRAFRDIMSSFSGRHVMGVSVQKMLRQGIEAIVGVTRDPNFGPVIMFGLGGVFVEVLKDITFRILPITEEGALEMMEEIRGSALLRGYRGMSVDIDALKTLLVKVSDLVTGSPEIRELDLNPVFLCPSGCTVADARIFVDECSQDQPGTCGRAGDDLHGMFYPASIAVVGASDVPGKLGYNVFHNLLSHGFQGRLFPINPKKESILGVKAYPSILELEDQVDVAIIIVPADMVPQAVQDCCSKGIRYVVIESAGFAEIGDEGKHAQERIRAAVREHGCRILGPNCSGIINTHHDMVQSIGIVDTLRKGNVGLISQAGVYAAGILAGLRNILDFGIVATIGNKMDISETDFLEYMGQDSTIDVIAMYMEDVSSGKRFADVAGRVSCRKPVIVLKTGRTEAGKKAVSSHTASLAGNDEINNAAFRQCGVIRARDNEHLFSLMRGFSKQPLPKGPGVMVVTYTGSLGVAATDMLYSNGLKLSEFDPELKEQLAALMPDYLNNQNPVDCSFSMTPEQVRTILEMGTRSSSVQSFMVIIPGEKLCDFVDVMKDLDYRGKPVVCCVACKEFMMDSVIRMEQAGIPVYSTPEMAAEVLGEMHRFATRRQRGIVKTLEAFLTSRTLNVEDIPVHFRLLKPSDKELWTEFVNGCSQESLWLRFLSPFSPSPERAQRFCDIDPDTECAIIAETSDSRSRKVIGIARLVRLMSREEAEYAVIISDIWQRKTLGFMLSEMSIELARQWGVTSVTAETIRENYPIIKVLKRCRFKVNGKCGNMVSLSLRVQ